MHDATQHRGRVRNWILGCPLSQCPGHRGMLISPQESRPIRKIQCFAARGSEALAISTEKQSSRRQGAHRDNAQATERQHPHRSVDSAAGVHSSAIHVLHGRVGPRSVGGIICACRHAPARR